MSRDPEDLGPSQPRRPRPPAGAPKRPGATSARSANRRSRRNHVPAEPGPAWFVVANCRGAGAGAGAKSAKGTRSTQFDSEYREPLAPGPKWWERIFFGRVSSGQLAQFCRQFASYLNAGVDYSRTFSSLEKQFAGSALGPAVGRMRLAIKGGSTLEEAMAREPQIFGTMFLSMIRVAEARGGVPETLRMMGNHYEARQRLIRQARSAMIYPVIVLTMAGGVIALLTIVLLPMFASMLKDIDRKIQLPLPSRALLAFSNFVSWVGWWLIPLVLVGTPFLIYRFYKTSPGKALIDRLILRTPVFGALCRKLDISRFARTLSTLLDAGVDVGSSIDLTAGVLAMTPISQAVRAAKDKVMQGKELSAALRPPASFPPTSSRCFRPVRKRGRSPKASTTWPTTTRSKSRAWSRTWAT